MRETWKCPRTNPCEECKV